MFQINRYYSGRINRTQYIGGSVGLIFLMFIWFSILYFIVITKQFQTINVMIEIIMDCAYIAVLILSFGLSTRRWHDVGKSSWWNILLLIGGVNFFAWIYLLGKEGQQSSNKFGPLPKKPFNVINVILNT